MVELSTVANFRPIGPSRNVQGLRAGLYRSAAFDRLGDDDAGRLQALGVGLCVDLRGPSEKQRAPNRWPSDWQPRVLELEILSDIRSLGPEFVHILVERPDREGAMELMHALYRKLPAASAAALCTLLNALTEPPEAPAVVIHCTAGKDRTGFVAAVLSTVLGLTQERIVADYLLSNAPGNQVLADARVLGLLEALLGMTPNPGIIEALGAADASYLATAMDQMRHDYGSIEGYLEQAGLDGAMRQRLQKRFVD
jgi:protein-tyrosine phosphatase